MLNKYLLIYFGRVEFGTTNIVISFSAVYDGAQRLSNLFLIETSHDGFLFFHQSIHALLFEV